MKRNFLRMTMVAALACAPLIAASTSRETMSPLENKVRRELVTLPFYSVFDNLQFSVNGDTVVLSGQVYRPTMKKSAERAVERLEGVETVVNNIEVLPVSFHDDRVRMAVL
ncbi:MAG: BON domain-containing protein, partial [Blastocatellia bacterium]